MTLTELAKKHNLDHDSAMAFLREWLSMQPVLGYQSEGYQLFENDFKTPLIARPTLGE